MVGVFMSVRMKSVDSHVNVTMDMNLMTMENRVTVKKELLCYAVIKHLPDEHCFIGKLKMVLLSLQIQYLLSLCLDVIDKQWLLSLVKVSVEAAYFLVSKHCLSQVLLPLHHPALSFLNNCLCKEPVLNLLQFCFKRIIIQKLEQNAI